MAKFECPMCRRPYSHWARMAAIRGEALVNATRWRSIQNSFAVEVRNKRDGKSSQIVLDSMRVYKESLINGEHVEAGAVGGSSFAKPGEIRQEYLELLRAEEEKERLRHEKEEKESLDFIKRLLVCS